MTSQPPTASTPLHFSRRRVIQIAGCIGVGVVAAVLGKTFYQPCPSISASRNSTSTRKKTDAGELVAPQTFQFEVVTVDEWGKITNRRQRQANFYVEDLGNGISLEMVEIPGGCFIRGPSAWESFNADGIPSGEGPQRRVTVPAFFMSKFAVTQAQYKAVTGKNPSYFKGANRPVEKVSWYDAATFCSLLTKRTGRTYRLPSEAEWEYVARAGTKTKFHFGQSLTTDLANYDGNYAYPDTTAPKGQYRAHTTDVGSFPPNAFGLYDIHGNVWEWCIDHMRSYVYAPIDGSASLSDNPKQYRIVRGGAWNSHPGNCTSGHRYNLKPDDRTDDCGFRVVAMLA